MNRVLKQQSFLISALVLAVGGIVAKVIGAFYKIPLTHILGSNGMGVYYLIFPIYSLFLVISSSGISLAVTKLVASERKNRNKKNEAKFFKVGLINAIVLSLIFSILILFLSKSISINQGNVNAYWGYIVIAPAIIFASIISIIRGYFQGVEIMIPTSLSNIFEQLSKLLFGLLLSYKFLNYGIEFAVVGAVLGVTISEFFAMIMLILNYYIYVRRERFYLKSERARNKSNIFLFYNSKVFLKKILKPNKIITGEFFEHKKYNNITTAEAFKKILKYSVYATLSSVVIPITAFIDSFLVINLLTAAGFSSTISTSLYGLSNGIVSSLISLPVLLISSLSTAIVPNLSNSDSSGERTVIESKCGFYIKITWLLALPICIFFIIYSNEIINILFGKGLVNRAFDEFAFANKLLIISSIQIIYYGFLQTFTSILQAINKPSVPVIALVISLVFRILLLILLAKNPAINVFAVSISNIVFLSFATIICLLFLKREIALNFSKKSFLIFPVMAVAISSVISYGLKIFLANYLSELIYSIISGSIGIIVYIVLILSFNIFNEKEAEMIPFSKKIFKRLRA